MSREIQFLLSYDNVYNESDHPSLSTFAREVSLKLARNRVNLLADATDTSFALGAASTWQAPAPGAIPQILTSPTSSFSDGRDGEQYRSLYDMLPSGLSTVF